MNNKKNVRKQIRDKFRVPIRRITTNLFLEYLGFSYTSTDNSNHESNNLFLYAFVPSPSLPSPDRLQEKFKKATTRFFWVSPSLAKLSAS